MGGPVQIVSLCARDATRRGYLNRVEYFRGEVRERKGENSGGGSSGRFTVIPR